MPSRRLQVVLDLDTGRYSGRLSAAGSQMRTFGGQVTQASSGVRQFGSSMNNLGGAMSTPLQKLRDYTLILGNIRMAMMTVRDMAVGWVGALLRQSAEVERLTTLLRGLSTANTEAGKTRDAQQSLASLYEMARTTGFEVRALADAMVKFRSGGLDPTTYSLRGLVDAVAAFGGNSEVLHRASIAIQQMAGKGVISMEELRQQLGEAVPTAMRIMAHAAGKTVAEFTAAVARGRVQARPHPHGMLRDMEILYAGAGERLANTMFGQLGQLRTNITLLSTEFTGLANAASSPFIDAQRRMVEQGHMTQAAFDRAYSRSGSTLFAESKKALEDLNNMLRSPEGRQAARDFGSAIGSIAGSLANMIRWVVEWRREFGTALHYITYLIGGLMARSFATWLFQLGMSLGSMAITFTAAAGDMARACGSLGSAMIGRAAYFTNATTIEHAHAVATARNAGITLAATQAEVAATRAKVAALAMERPALVASMLALRQRVAQSAAAVLMAQREIDVMGSTLVRTQALAQARNVLSVAEADLALVRGRLVVVDAELAIAETALTTATAANVVATETATAAVGRLTLAYRAWVVIAGIATTAVNVFKAAVSFLLHPLVMLATLLGIAASQASNFGSEATAAAEAADRLRASMGNLADAQTSIRRIQAIDEELNTRTNASWMHRAMMGGPEREAELARERASLRRTIDSPQVRGSAGYNTGAEEWQGVERRNTQQRAMLAADLEVQMQREDLTARMERGERAAFTRRTAIMLQFQQTQHRIAVAQRDSVRASFTAARGRGDLAAMGGFAAMLEGAQRQVDATSASLRGLAPAADAAAASTARAGGAAGGAGNRAAGMEGQVARLQARLGGTHGELAKFNAELAGGQHRELTVQQIANTRAAAASIDALHLALAGRRADEAFGDRLANVAGRIASLREELAGGEGELARFNAQVDAGLFTGVSSEKLDLMREMMRTVDGLTARGSERTVADRLGRDLAKATEESDLLWQSFTSDTMDADQKVTQLRARFAGMMDGITDPARLAEFEDTMSRVTQKIQNGEMAVTADQWRTEAETIRVSLMAEDEQRQANFDREVQRRQALLDNFVGTERQKWQAEVQFNAWRHQAQVQLQRANESSTTRMARDWANLGSNIDRALGNALGNFVDGMFDAEFNFGKFAIGLIKELMKIILKAMIAYAILSALGLAQNSSGQKVSFGDFMRGQVQGGLGAGNNSATNIGFGVNGATIPAPAGVRTPGVDVTQDAPVGVGHIGGVIGALTQWTNVNSSVFKSAKAYHRGGEIGGRRLRPGEVPMIGMAGEVVLTEEHQALLGRRLAQGGSGGMPNVQVNVINNSGTELETEHGEPEFNGREMIVNVVVEAAQKQGPLRDILAQVSKGG